MKISIDYKRAHLRFIFGTGFVLFVLRKVIGAKDKEAAQEMKPICKQIKKLLKEYKKANGPFNFVEIEDGKDKTRIVIKV